MKDKFRQLDVADWVKESPFFTAKPDTQARPLKQPPKRSFKEWKKKGVRD